MTAAGLSDHEESHQRREVAAYDYLDAAGNLSHRVVRCDPKSFRQCQPDGKGGWIWNLNGIKRVLYHLPEVIGADEVLVVEGEKDADTATSLGFVATTNPGGAGKGRKEYSETLRGKHVTIIPDADAPGRAHAQQVVESLSGVAANIKVLALPQANDLTEWVESGGSREEVCRLIHDAPEPPSTGDVDDPKPPKIHSANAKGEVLAERILFRTAADLAQDTTANPGLIAYPGVYTGSILELDGSPKTAGKTTFALHLCNAILDHKDFLGQPTVYTPVVYLTEQPVGTFKKQLEETGAIGRKDLYYLPYADTLGHKWPPVARRAIKECRAINAKLLIVDTLPQFAGILGDAENNSGDALQAIQPLQEAARQGIAVVIVRHDRKSGGPVGQSGRGSSAFSGAVDTVLNLKCPDGNHRSTLRLLQGIGRFSGIPDQLMIELTPDGYTAIGDTKTVEGHEAESKILGCLPDNEGDAMEAEEVATATDCRRTTVQNTLKSLASDGKVTRIGAGKKGDPYRYFLSAKTPSTN